MSALMNPDAPTAEEAARDAWLDEQPPLRDGVYHVGAEEFVAIAEYDGDFWVCGYDGKVHRYTPASVPYRRRADCLERQHELAAKMVRVIRRKRGKQLREFARDQLHKILDEAEL